MWIVPKNVSLPSPDLSKGRLIFVEYLIRFTHQYISNMVNINSEDDHVEIDSLNHTNNGDGAVSDYDMAFLLYLQIFDFLGIILISMFNADHYDR